MPYPSVAVKAPVKITDKFEAIPSSQHAAPNSLGGAVEFTADKPCELQFYNPAVFNRPTVSLGIGTTVLPVEVEKGHTRYKVVGSQVQTMSPRSGTSPEGGPNEIVVP